MSHIRRAPLLRRLLADRSWRAPRRGSRTVQEIVESFRRARTVPGYRPAPVSKPRLRRQESVDTSVQQGPGEERRTDEVPWEELAG